SLGRWFESNWGHYFRGRRVGFERASAVCGLLRAVVVDDVVYTIAGLRACVVNCWTRAGWREHFSFTAPTVPRAAFPLRIVSPGRFATLNDFGQGGLSWHQTDSSALPA